MSRGSQFRLSLALALALVFFALLPAGLCRPASSPLRLVDGAGSHEGTLLVRHNSTWGFVCDDGWNERDADVACRQMGLGRALRRTVANEFGSDVTAHQIVLDDVDCTGAESSLSECFSRQPGSHDCHQSEAAGVVCSQLGELVTQPPAWNPLRMANVEAEALRRMAKPVYRLWLGAQKADGSSALIVRVGNAHGGVCLDTLTLREANVACAEAGRGMARLLKSVKIADIADLDVARPVMAVGNCRGDERRLGDCDVFGSAVGVPCGREGEAAAVVCTNYLPDLVPDVKSLQSSAHTVRVPMYHMQCALEENCAAPAAFEIQKTDPNWMFASRTLLRFSSIVGNEGTASFVPARPTHNWEWHLCHMHYHSMSFFANYEVYVSHNSSHQTVASGHKASFCLEDNDCLAGVRPHFQCSQDPGNRGSQGISPGCKDIYLHDLDCQWVDVTEVPVGDYKFRVVVNPEYLVAESNYSNNAILCNLHFAGNSVQLTSCRLGHPFDY